MSLYAAVAAAVAAAVDAVYLDPYHCDLVVK